MRPACALAVVKSQLGKVIPDMKNPARPTDQELEKTEPSLGQHCLVLITSLSPLLTPMSTGKVYTPQNTRPGACTKYFISSSSPDKLSARQPILHCLPERPAPSTHLSPHSYFLPALCRQAPFHQVLGTISPGARHDDELSHYELWPFCLQTQINMQVFTG